MNDQDTTRHNTTGNPKGWNRFVQIEVLGDKGEGVKFCIHDQGGNDSRRELRDVDRRFHSKRSAVSIGCSQYPEFKAYSESRSLWIRGTHEERDRNTMHCSICLFGDIVATIQDFNVVYGYPHVQAIGKGFDLLHERTIAFLSGETYTKETSPKSTKKKAVKEPELPMITDQKKEVARLTAELKKLAEAKATYLAETKVKRDGLIKAKKIHIAMVKAAEAAVKELK